MKKRIGSVLLALALCLSLLPATALAEGEDSTGTPSAVAQIPESITGAGTEESPYQISTAEQLYAFAQWYNENAENLLANNTNTYAELTSDIDLNPNFIFTKDGCTGEGTPQEWKPIGLISLNFSSQLPYLGEFDGNGYTISGLYINESSTTEMAGGLFGYLAGYIHDVNLENSYINSKSACTGSFAGVLEGTIENCTAYATVISDANPKNLTGTGGIVGNLSNLNGSTSEAVQCTFNGLVKANNAPYIGGIVGDNVYGYIADCTNNGTVTSSKWDKVGGIVGNNQIPDSSNEPVKGKSAVIERCVNNGAISGPNDNSGDYVGGIVGMSSWSFGGEYFGAVRNCLNTGTITGCVSGGIIGYLEETTSVENCLNTGTISGSPSGGIAGQQLSSCAIKNSYYQEAENLTAVGKLGNDQDKKIPTEEEQISEENARATAEKISSGEVSWKLNTENGTKENSGIWTKNADQPKQVSGSAKATCKVIFDFPEGTDDVIAYTSDDGTVAIPEAANGKLLTYQKDGKTEIFTEDTIVTADITVNVAEKVPCQAPIFANNTDTLSASDDKEAVFTLASEPVEGTIFRVYSAETDGEVIGAASWSGTTLTVTLNTVPTSNTTYYVSMTTPTSIESSRSPIVVNVYVRPSHSSSSSSSSTYPVTTPDKTENGSVTVTPKSAKRGSVVTITVTPDAGYVLDKLTVTDKDGKELSLTKKSDTEYTFVMPAGKVEITPSFVKQAEEPSRVFVDVKTGDYFYDAVLWAVEKGITNGTSAETFSPEDPCTRAQIVTFLWRAAGSPVVNYAMNMTDVAADAYYAEAVRWALSEGVTTGTSADQFSPDATCTREQAVTFLWRAAGSPAVSGESAFEDVGADAYYARAVAWAAQNGVTNGISQALFGTGSDCTRAQIVTFLYRAQQGK